MLILRQLTVPVVDPVARLVERPAFDPLTTRRIECVRLVQVNVRRAAVAAMELVEAELVPGLRVLGLKPHGIAVRAQCGSGVLPRLLDARAGKERRERERVERTRLVGRIGGGRKVSSVERL